MDGIKINEQNKSIGIGPLHLSTNRIRSDSITPTNTETESDIHITCSDANSALAI